MFKQEGLKELEERQIKAQLKDEGIEGLKAQLEDLNREKAFLQRTLREKESRIEGLKANLNALEERLISLTQEFNRRQDTYVATAGELEEIKSLNASLKKRLNSLYVELELLRIENQQER